MRRANAVSPAANWGGTTKAIFPPAVAFDPPDPVLPQLWIVTMHGLDGESRDMANFAAAMRACLAAAGVPRRNARWWASRSGHGARSHRGVGALGDDLATELCSSLRRAGAAEHPAGTRLVLAGHSLGGLVLRHALPQLRQFCAAATAAAAAAAGGGGAGVELTVLCTFATPHAGARHLPQFLQKVMRLMRRPSIDDLMLEGRVLDALCGGEYLAALRAVRHRVLYQSIGGDPLVAWHTGAMTLQPPPTAAAGARRGRTPHVLAPLSDEPAASDAMAAAAFHETPEKAVRIAAMLRGLHATRWERWPVSFPEWHIAPVWVHTAMVAAPAKAHSATGRDVVAHAAARLSCLALHDFGGAAERCAQWLNNGGAQWDWGVPPEERCPTPPPCRSGAASVAATPAPSCLSAPADAGAAAAAAAAAISGEHNNGVISPAHVMPTAASW